MDATLVQTSTRTRANSAPYAPGGYTLSPAAVLGPHFDRE